MKDPFVMRIMDVPGPFPDGTAVYLFSFDLSDDPRGRFQMTLNPGDAMQFEGFLGVMEAWGSVSPLVPVRDDGKPNKPLTIFTIEPVPLVRLLPTEGRPQ